MKSEKSKSPCFNCLVFSVCRAPCMRWKKWDEESSMEEDYD